MSKPLNHEYRSGMRQGERDRACGMVLRACPYRQWPISQLCKYRRWVAGWFKTYHLEHGELKPKDDWKIFQEAAKGEAMSTRDEVEDMVAAVRFDSEAEKTHVVDNIAAALDARDKEISELQFLRAALDRLNDDCLRAEQEREQLRTKLAEAESQCLFKVAQIKRLSGLLLDAEHRVREAEHAEDGTWREKFFMALNDLEVLRFSHEQELREAETRGLEWALELLPTRLGVRVWAEDVRAAINAEIARLTQVDEQERYDCPIHGTGDGKDCPRC